MVLSRSQSKSSGKLPYDLANKVLNRLPAEYRKSFTIEQVEALHTAMVMQNALEQGGTRQIQLWQTNLGPLGLSLSLRNERQIQAQKARRQSKLVPVLCMLVAILGAGCVAGLLKFRSEYPLDGLVTSLSEQDQSPYPITLPSHKDQATCEESGSVWVDQTCVNYNYSPMF
ncbi:hypothetical protein [Leptothoe kymatousa]|uniref:Uncharacterized protein n=1 Tax=Leptothoe kymatousa TAU-MAC 1615 TaxID=2364775 RepID=A0ABS5Y5M5_9CYAN|nr:hypothetical protein [Leptothoe kymatousa]MBT9312280.1 hypothetical protein [Leptothoe kymatousa TAU-MAC 1615]